MEIGRYIYCIIEEKEKKSFGNLGIVDNNEVYTINQDGLAVVVSEALVQVYVPRRKDMLAHNKVLEEVMKNYYILPARFGLVAENEEKIKKLLTQRYSELKEYLKKVTKKREIGIKVFWEKEGMIKDIEKEEGREIGKIKEKIASASPGEQRDMLIKAGEMVQRLTEEWKKRYIERVYKELQKISVDSKENESYGYNAVLNTAFLVEEGKVKEFEDKINELDSEYGEKINFKYIPAIAPYNFVNLEIMLSEIK